MEKATYKDISDHTYQHEQPTLKQIKNEVHRRKKNPIICSNSLDHFLEDHQWQGKTGIWGRGFHNIGITLPLYTCETENK